MKKNISIFWFRRDLRLTDNTGLNKALTGQYPILPIFIFDTEILDSLAADDARVSFIYGRLQQLRESLQNEYGSGIALYHGRPVDVFEKLMQKYNLQSVYTNRDYEPYAKKRDTKVSEALKANRIPFHSFKDQVIFEEDEVVKEDGSPYVVYTPYMKKWKMLFADGYNIKTPVLQNNLQGLAGEADFPNPTLQELGFSASPIKVPDFTLPDELLANYAKRRDYPGANATSGLSPHLRFGTVSVREVVRIASSAKDETFLNELVWREFFMQILWHFPETTHRAFRKEYDGIRWRNSETDFEKWKRGMTGYAMVDAGMRQLNQTGLMHNRVRMVVASFLCKHLLIDWRWGEAYFAEKLLDFELSSNVGNWQWAAGCGVDAAPYFRIFNPMTQVSKFDKDESYIRKWVPEYGSGAYPDKMVDHKMARERCLEAYKKALG